jgi:radical SAM protein with 4Fe4S-binding SPASM domain
MMRRRTIVLVVTHRCNLACSYCYQDHKSRQRMTLDHAKGVFAGMFEASPGFDELEFDFIGGEPFLEFELIRDLCEWAWGNSWSKPYVFFATTNGTVFTGAMKDWLTRHRERFYVSLSFDGLPQAQCMNRSNSSERIDLNFFAGCWPDQPAKMTVSPESLPLLADGVIFLHEHGFRVGANLALGIPWDSRLVEPFAGQLDALAEYYLGHPNITPANILDMKLHGILDERPGPRKFCGTHDHMITIDTDGEAYPCHTFTPLVLTPQQISELRKMDLDDLNLYDSELCSHCSILKICPTCYGLNYKVRGKLSERDTGDYCRFIKTQVRANCRFQASRLQATWRNDGALGQDDYLTAQAILKIARSL